MEKHIDMNCPSTRILKWKDGKKGVFLLGFDDGAPTALGNVMPELLKREMPGTFFICPNTEWYRKHQREWECPPPGMDYANHTFSHSGAKTSAELDDELAKCNAEIAKAFPHRKLPRLISYAQPGGAPWTVSHEETEKALAKHNLIVRPPRRTIDLHSFKALMKMDSPPEGYPFKVLSLEDILSMPELALNRGEMEYLLFHGIGGDWLSMSMEWFIALLDEMYAVRDKLWITDFISYHKYAVERDNTAIIELATDGDFIRIKPVSALKHDLYDFPLTFATEVPPEWQTCLLIQDKSVSTVKAKDGIITYSALPFSEISIRHQR